MVGFKEGYAYYQKTAGIAESAFEGAAYVDSVSAEIDKLTDTINQFSGNQKEASILSGDVAELWHSGTFNIDAAVKGSSNRAAALRDNGLGSVDILLNSGEKYGSKYDNTVYQTSMDQAKTFFERYKEYAYQCQRRGVDPPSFDDYIRANADNLRQNGIDPDKVLLHDPLYAGQYRLVPADQYDGIKAFLERRIREETAKRPEQVKRYQDALDMLTENVKDAEGNHSIPLSKDEAKQLADIAKEGGFNPSEWRLTTENLILPKYILQQAFQAGLTSATISIVLRIAPEIIKSISYLINVGEINKEQFRKIGISAVKGSAEGFVRGSISAAITTACKAGLWGQTLTSVNPAIIGCVTVIAFDTISNAFRVAIGKKSPAQMTEEMIQEVFVSSCSLAFGSIVQGLLSELPVVGYLLGSFIGSFIGSITYSVGHRAFMSICIDRGFSMFGLVTQDYRLPTEVIDQLGITRFEPDIFEPNEFQFGRFTANGSCYDRFEHNQIDLVFLRRGMVATRRVAFVCA